MGSLKASGLKLKSYLMPFLFEFQCLVNLCKESSQAERLEERGAEQKAVETSWNYCRLPTTCKVAAEKFVAPFSGQFICRHSRMAAGFQSVFLFRRYKWIGIKWSSMMIVIVCDVQCDPPTGRESDRCEEVSPISLWVCSKRSVFRNAANSLSIHIHKIGKMASLTH